MLIVDCVRCAGSLVRIWCACVLRPTKLQTAALCERALYSNVCRTTHGCKIRLFSDQIRCFGKRKGDKRSNRRSWILNWCARDKWDFRSFYQTNIKQWKESVAQAKSLFISFGWNERRTNMYGVQVHGTENLPCTAFLHTKIQWKFFIVCRNFRRTNISLKRLGFTGGGAAPLSGGLNEILYVCVFARVVCALCIHGGGL